MPGMTPARQTPVAEQFSFGDALKQALMGRRVRRVEWPEGTSIYFSMAQHDRPGPGGILRIGHDGSVSDLIVQDGDVVATDWVVVLEH